jgi:hypothetical protein
MEYDWLAALVEFLDVEDAAEWLRDPCAELDGESPLALCAAGRQEEVAAAVEDMIGETDPDADDDDL